jgi:hypothetical protein
MSMPEHGTIYRHKRFKCKCGPCRDVWVSYNSRRRRQQAYGTWQPLVDAGPARAHLLALREAGFGIRRVAALAGVAAPTLTKITNGSKRRVRPETETKILAVQAGTDTIADGVHVDGTGTRRRLQALAALGWPITALAERVDVSKVSLHSCLAGHGTTARTARIVRDLYDSMWDQSPPESNRVERSIAQRSRIGAARKGWAPPMAWDDDTIDDPNAKPEGAGKAFRGKLPHPDEVAWLHYELGETVQALAMRFSVEVDSVRQALHRAAKEPAA